MPGSLALARPREDDCRRTLQVSFVLITLCFFPLTLVIYDLASLLEIDWVYTFVVPIILVSRHILDLTTMSRATMLAVAQLDTY